MSITSTPLDIEVPAFGKVPIQVTHGKDPSSPIDITHRPPMRGDQGDEHDALIRFKNPRIVLVNDGRSRLPLYAVRQQKVITLTKDQFAILNDAGTIVGALDDKQAIQKELRSITQQRSSRIISTDCPDPDGQFTVLLDWEEDTTLPFPDVVLRDSDGNIKTPISQTNNYLIVCLIDQNSKPGHPPATTGPLNTQPSDFRPATVADVTHYRENSGPPGELSVAVMDTGLKFNLLNRGHEADWPKPYTYCDADGRELSFKLAYQQQPDSECGSIMAENHLGYCALGSYRESTFIAGMEPLLTTPPTAYTPADVVNSPFDDFRLFSNPPDENSIMDARHGTSVTAIIQQQGDDVPVLPVKVFDNIGFATVFDVINGFNYILRRCESSNIRIVNASWIYGQDNPLIRNKIRQLMEAGVFVVAAAGNESQTTNRNLDVVPVYPACYSDEFPNVITVTSVRKTYFRPDVLSPKQDSIIGKVLRQAIKVGLFDLLEGADDLVGAILPTAGYVAVENYSTKFVNVGVVSTFGYYRSPFWKSPIIRGSSFACAFVTGFVVRQLRAHPDLLVLLQSGQEADIHNARQQLLEAMNGEGPDTNLSDEYVKGGYYLNGHAVD